MGAPATNTATNTCPDENALVSFIEGRLSGERITAIETHIDGCTACASVMDELAEVIAPLSQRPEQGDVLIGRYEVLEEIGSGGMGVVYAAYDPELRRKIALKLLRPDIGHFADVPAARARLLREARLLATLSHPNIVTVFDVGAMGDDIFIAFELVEGRSLAEWLSEETPVWRDVAKIYLQAARGVLAAHQAGLVHRDIKPANVLLSHDGSVRVTDFGLAIAATEEASGVRGASRADTSLITQTGAVVGTPAYMAPEQYAGRGADARSDQFSFCVSLAEAFTGDRPTAGATADNLADTASQHARKPPPRPLLDVVSRGLSARAADRHDDMAAVATALELALDGEAERIITTKDQTTDDTGRPPPPTTRRGSNLGWLLAVGLTGALVWAVMRNARPESESASTPVNLVTASDVVPTNTVAPDPSAVPPEVSQAEPPELPPESAVSAVDRPGGSIVPTSPASSPSSTKFTPVRAADHAFTGASRHHQSGEGSACLSKLAEGARINPPRAALGHYTQMRAQCMMMNGDCAGGRSVLAAMMGAAATPSALDAQSIPSCRKRKATDPSSKQGAALMSSLDALYNEAAAAHAAKDVKRCKAVGAKIDAFVAKHQLGSEPALKHKAHGASYHVTHCLANSTDCVAAKAQFAKSYKQLYPELMQTVGYGDNFDKMFLSSFPQCK